MRQHNERGERLLTGDTEPIVDSGEHGRLPHATLADAAGQHLRAGGDRFLKPLLDALGRRIIDQRPNVGRLVKRIADDERVHAPE